MIAIVFLVAIVFFFIIVTMSFSFGAAIVIRRSNVHTAKKNTKNTNKQIKAQKPETNETRVLGALILPSSPITISQVTLQTGALLGNAYEVPTLKSSYLTRDLPKTFVLNKTKYVLASKPRDLFSYGNLYTTHQRHGSMNAVFVILKFTDCTPPIKFRSNNPTTEDAVKSFLPNFAKLLYKATNGHITLGSMTIAKLDMPCSGQVGNLMYSSNMFCSHADINAWSDYARAKLGIPLGTHTVLYVAGLPQCGWSGLSTVNCNPVGKQVLAPCTIWLNALDVQTFVHEVVHSYGSSHANGPENQEYGDESCIMGNGDEMLSCPHTYVNGWLDNAQFLQLEDVGKPGTATEITLQQDTRHGLVLCIPVVLFSGNQYSNVLPLPIYFISYRSYKKGKGNNVLVHVYNDRDFLPTNGHLLSSPTTNQVTKLNKLNQVHTLDLKTAKQVPLVYRHPFAPLNNTFASSLGFPSISSRPFSNSLTLTLLKMDNDTATIRLSASQ